MVDNVPEQASKVKLFSTFAGPLESSKFIETYNRYYEKTTQPFGIYSAAVYDICWIYTLSILASSSINPEILVKVIPEVANNYLGTSGICKLNEDGDRYSCNYQIWGYENKEGTPGVRVFGKYNDIDDRVQWHFDTKKDEYRLVERNQLLREIDKTRNEIPLSESDIVEFKQQLIKNKKIACILTSFANSKGGSLYIGVSDDREIIGVEDTDKTQLTLTNIARDSSIPPLYPSFTIIIENEKKVVQCYISPSENVHKVRDGKYYSRIGPSTRELSVEELGRLFRTKSNYEEITSRLETEFQEIKKLLEK